MIKEQVKWYPVYTNPRAEKKAFDLLTQKGIECYLPLYRQQKQWSDRKKWVNEPLIKSYVFVNIAASQITEVLMTNGVCRFLYFSGKIASMPDKQIEQLKLLLASESELEVLDHHFTKGELVKIIAGPLQGLIGELIEFQTQKRLLIKIEHVGQSVLVKINSIFTEPF
ncbi:MAG: hypothetical protein JWN56_1404 [Sphingobacteriales bacterium]|nr:hypothetical protein [Sphingobacteriales bacterium]